jgi:hypothetical protein
MLRLLGKSNFGSFFDLCKLASAQWLEVFVPLEEIDITLFKQIAVKVVYFV